MADTETKKPEFSWLETLGRGALAYGQGMTGQPFLTNYDKIKADAEEARLKIQSDILKQQAENQKWQFEQAQQLQQSGYQPISNFKGGNPSDFNAIKVPGGDGYFKPMVEAPKTYSEKLAAMKFDAVKSMDPAAQKDYLLGQKPVDDMSAWRLANTLATAENGGSLMSGIGDNKAAYEKSRQTWYEKLKNGVVAAGATDLTGKQSASDIDSY